MYTPKMYIPQLALLRGGIDLKQSWQCCNFDQKQFTSLNPLTLNMYEMMPKIVKV